MKDPADEAMTAAKPTKYHFIPSDDKLNKNQGFCVFDTLLGLYAKDVNTEIETKMRKLKMTKESITEMMREFYKKDDLNKINPLDWGIDEIEEEARWKPEDGITTKGVDHLCRYYNISYYAYDITNRCFSKYVATSRHYQALIYYCVGNHMYWVSDKQAALSLVAQARDIEVNASSNMIVDDTVVEKENVWKTRRERIYTNVPLEELGNEKYQDCIIMHSADYKHLGEATKVNDLPTFCHGIWDPAGIILSPQIVQV